MDASGLGLLANGELLVALIPAGAAVLGALVGGGTAYLGAVRGARVSQEGEAARWRRDRRESAYRETLATRNRLVRAYVEKANAMQQAAHEGRAQGFDFQHWQSVTDSLWAAFDEAVATVELFGSRDARDAVRAWAGEVRTTYAMATRSGGAFGAGMRAAQDDDNRRHRDPIIELVRRELGVRD